MFLALPIFLLKQVNVMCDPGGHGSWPLICEAGKYISESWLKLVAFVHICSTLGVHSLNQSLVDKRPVCSLCSAL